MIVCSPFAPLFSEPDFMSEQVDEILYGDFAEVLEESQGFCRIRTDYGYVGWTLKENLFEELYEPNGMVSSRFGDLLFEGRYHFRPAMCLPLGARICLRFPENEGRYALATYSNGQVYYVRRELVSPLKQPEKTNDEIRESIVNTAKCYLGVQYRWGGRTPLGVDCSGLCFNAYRFNGIGIWRDADIEKSPNLKKIGIDRLEKADLIFFENHVAMYLGNGEIIHASASRGKVVVENLNENEYLKENIICAGTAFNERNFYQRNRNSKTI